MSFTVLEILDRTFRIYRENFVSLISLVAVVTIPLTIINLIISLQTNPLLLDPSLMAGRRMTSQELAQTFGNSGLLCGLSLLSVVIGVLQFVLVYAPITYMTSEYQMGRRVTLGEAFGATQSRFTSLGCGYVLFIIAISVFIGFIVAIAGVLNCAPGFAALGIVVYIAIAASGLLAPAAVLEDTSTTGGVNRAWALGKARFWKTFGVGLLVGIVSVAITFAFSTIASLLAFGAFGTLPTLTNQVLLTAINTVISVFITPLVPIAMTLLYYDIRTNVEGLDLALQSFDDPNARPRHVPAPPRGGAITQQDIINIVILTGITIIVLLVFGAAIQALIQPFLPGLGQFRR